MRNEAEGFVVDEPLPEYEAPPVNEVAFGILTEPTAGLTVAHFGRFWERMANRFPRAEEAPPLLPLVETLESAGGTVNLELGDVLPLPRLWLISQDGRTLIQLQRDRFLFNWRKVDDTDSYPRFEAIEEGFRRALQDFTAFLKDSHLPGIQPVQYELTYINNIGLPGANSVVHQVKQILRDYVWEGSHRFLGEADQFNSA